MQETLHGILDRLDRMDRRDRLRTWGGFFKSLIAIIPIILVVYSTWYVYENMDEILKKVATQAASSAAEASKNSSADFIKSVQGMMKQ